MKHFFILFSLATISTLFAFSTTKSNSTSSYKKVDAIEFHKLTKDLKKGVILDVRTAREFSAGHIKNAMNIDWYSPSFKDDVAKINKYEPVYIYCHSGGRSNAAANLLKDQGFNTIVELGGGITAWRKAKFPEVK